MGKSVSDDRLDALLEKLREKMKDAPDKEAAIKILDDEISSVGGGYAVTLSDDDKKE